MLLWIQSQPLRVISIIFAGSSLAYYMLMTTLAIYLHSYLKLTVATVGTIIFGYVFISRLAKVILGPWFDRLSLRTSLTFSLSIAATGFFLAATDNLIGILAPWSLCIAGIGISSVVLLTQSCIARQKQALLTEVHAPADYSFIYVLMHSSALVAPAIGFTIMRHFPGGLYWIIGGFYLLLLLFCRLFLPEPQLPAPAMTNKPVITDFLTAFRKQHYCRFLLINSLLWMLYAQLFSTIPLYIREILGEKSNLTLFYMVEALTVMTLQHWVSTYINQHIQASFHQVALVIFSLSFLLIYYAHSMVLILLAGCLFAFALMIFMPCSNAVNAAFAEPGRFATYFGLVSLSATLGDSLGSALGMTGFNLLLQSGMLRDYFLWLAGITVALAFLRRNPYNCPL
ncbi:major Facilitator Superfamily protein [Yersinia ruckeri]|uniref:MFS transporter n=1 Tax=Yersinia ruckeri TaxID=29486 RepID=UPI0005AC74F9|nr:MFS transporter [Yersinia ruckeri]AJI95956.1 major Facilitator Superfamily protein [Yersinia ruckeri]MCW6567061.1 MFS transporter [Yersinia ruckeri]